MVRLVLLFIMVLTLLLLALLLLQIIRRQFRRPQTFLLMKTKINNLYGCDFVADGKSRSLKVVAQSFGAAASLAYSQSSNWDDKDKYELDSICVLGPVVVGF